MSSAEEFVSEDYPSYYNLAESLAYVRKTGTSEYDHIRLNPVVNLPASFNAPEGSPNGQSQTVSFKHTFTTTGYYLFSEQELHVSGYLCRRDSHSNPLPTSRSSTANTDFTFDYGYIKVGPNELISSYKDNLDMSAHLSKLISYTPEYARLIEYEEMFFPDTGLDARPNRVPYTVKATVSTDQNDGVDGDTNVIQVGTQGGTGSQQGALVDVTDSATAHGNAYFSISDNPYYNRGYAKRHSLLNSGSIKRFTFAIKLKHLFKGLETMNVALNNFDFELYLRRSHDSRVFQTAGVPDGGNVGREPKLYIESLTLQIPMVKPNPRVDEVLRQRILTGTSYRARYVDVEVHIWPNLIPAGSGRTVADFTAILNRRPIGCLVGYQYASETTATTLNGNTYDPFNGNIMRFVNVQPTMAKSMIGNNLVFPREGHRCNPTNDDYLELYREFLRFTGYLRQDKFAPVLDYESYKNHKFLIPFDFRDIDEKTWYLDTHYNLRFQIDHAPIPALPADAADARDAGSPLGGSCRLVNFLFLEREVLVHIGPDGTRIEFDVPPLR